MDIYIVCQTPRPVPLLENQKSLTQPTSCVPAPIVLNKMANIAAASAKKKTNSLVLAASYFEEFNFKL